jgi:hypothetical protein
MNVIVMQLNDFKHEYEDNFIKIYDVKLKDYNYKKLENETIDNMKQVVLKDSYCMGFSTDGFMKFYIDLNKLEKCENNHLYIHNQRFIYFENRNSRTNIPKKIHFIWFSSGKEFNLINYIAIKAALDHNPTYQVYLHCDDTPKNNIYFDNIQNKIIINEIIEPKIINNHIVKWFQNKADYVRLNALKKFGGIYLDTDYILIKPLDHFLNHKFVMGYERANNKDFLCNAVIMCEPNSDIIKEWINVYDNSWGEDYVAYWFGHSVLIPAQLRDKYNYIMTIYDSYVFYPFLWDDLSILHDHDNGKSYKSALGVHLWDTEASKTNLLPNDVSYFKNKKNAFVRLFKEHVTDLNPVVSKIEDQFEIYEGKDSPGYDLRFCGGKSIEELKQICLQDPTCVGFNTLGFLKHKIDLDRLVNFKDIGWNNCTNNDNLYVHKERKF